MGGRIVIPGCKSYMTVDFPAGETPSHGLRGLQRMPRVITDGGFDKQSKLGIWRVRNREIMLRFWELHRTSPRYKACCRPSSLWRHAQPEHSSSSSFCRKPLHVAALWCHARPHVSWFSVCCGTLLHVAALWYHARPDIFVVSSTFPHYRASGGRTYSSSSLCCRAFLHVVRAMLQCAAGQPRGFLCVSAHSSTLPRYVATRGRTASSSPTCIRTFFHGSALCCLTASSFICAAAHSPTLPRFGAARLVVSYVCRTLLHRAALWRHARPYWTRRLLPCCHAGPWPL